MLTNSCHTFDTQFRIRLNQNIALSYIDEMKVVHQLLELLVLLILKNNHILMILSQL
jgi:hypothetical protein